MQGVSFFFVSFCSQQQGSPTERKTTTTTTSSWSDGEHKPLIILFPLPMLLTMRLRGGLSEVRKRVWTSSSISTLLSIKDGLQFQDDDDDDVDDVQVFWMNF